MTDIGERLRSQLQVPASLMGGETFILRIKDVQEAAAEIERARLAERQALAVADARSIENVGLRAALKEIQALSLKTENANLVWQRATRALEE